jgi:hypothetical protein
LIEIKEPSEGVRSDGGRTALPGVNATQKAAVGVCKELEMNTLLRFSAVVFTAAAALFVAQPSQAVTPVVQPHSTIADTANADSLVTTVARRGGVYRGRTVYRGRSVYRGRGVYRGRAVYRRGVVRRGIYYGATGGYGQPCGYYPYPPCATGYYGGGVYRGGVAVRRGGVYRSRSVYRGGGRKVTHYRRGGSRRR